MKNWNSKTKGEQIFLLCLIFICAFGLLCITGCGGNSCETPKCQSDDTYGTNAKVISLPGCGGCMTSGRGCDSCLWAQSCKFISVSGVEESEVSKAKEDFKGCDVRYYDGGCLGCGYEEKSCYSGWIKIESDSEDKFMNGIIYGTSDGSEKYIGCVGGCGGCVGTNGLGREFLQRIEYMIGDE